MSYWGRSAYEVQRDNGRHFDFDKIATHYESIKPLRGKRASLNIRPVGERNRDWERVVKVNDDEYYLTNSSWRWYDSSHNTHGRTHQKLISFKRFDGGESVTIHTPTWGEGKQFDSRALGVSSTFYFIYFNLPKGLSFANIKSCKYVELDGKYYSAEKGDITFTRMIGQTEWKPYVVHREFIHHIDRQKTKELKQRATPFLNYANVMFDMLEPNHHWRNGFKDDNYTWEDLLDPIENGEPNPMWVELVERFKYRTRMWDSGKTICMKALLEGVVLEDLKRIAKPLKAIEVPLGTPCRDTYKNW